MRKAFIKSFPFSNVANFFIRQELFLGGRAQKMLGKKSAAVIGLGSLGSKSAEMLARAGIGKLTLADFDVVRPENIGTQQYYAADLRKPKSFATKKRLEGINPKIKITARNSKITSKNIQKIVGKPDILIDGTDNMETRYIIDDYCKKKRIPWVMGTCVRSEGFVYTSLPGGPYYRDIFPRKMSNETCDTCGVLNSIASIISATQVTEALKILTGKQPCRDLLFFDVWRNVCERVKVKKHK